RRPRGREPRPRHRQLPRGLWRVRAVLQGAAGPADGAAPRRPAMTRIEMTGTTERGDGVQVELVLDEPCVQGCAGRGMVEHPLWAEFNAADRAIAEERGIGHTLTEEHRAWERAWWGERGYRVTLDVGF